MKALVTGQVVSSVRLVFKPCCFLPGGWEVIGVDNDSRGSFLGMRQHRENRTVAALFFPKPEPCRSGYPRRARRAGIVEKERPGFIIHTAARLPDLAASIPYEIST